MKTTVIYEQLSLFENIAGFNKISFNAASRRIWGGGGWGRSASFSSFLVRDAVLICDVSERRVHMENEKSPRAGSHKKPATLKINPPTLTRVKEQYGPIWGGMSAGHR